MRFTVLVVSLVVFNSWSHHHSSLLHHHCSWSYHHNARSYHHSSWSHHLGPWKYPVDIHVFKKLVRFGRKHLQVFTAILLCNSRCMNLYLLVDSLFQVPGYTMKDIENNQWKYSRKLQSTLEEYISKFSELFEYLASVPSEENYYEEDIFGED